MNNAMIFPFLSGLAAFLWIVVMSPRTLTFSEDLATSTFAIVMGVFAAALAWVAQLAVLGIVYYFTNGGDLWVIPILGSPFIVAGLLHLFRRKRA